MSASPTIPMIDLENYTRSPERSTLTKWSREKVEGKASEICDAFRTWGFAYIVNHGIPNKQIDDARQTSRQFFELPEAKKRQVERGGNNDNHGWVGLEVENLNPVERPGDYKEAFNAYAFEGTCWPDTDVPKFRSALKTLNSSCEQLSLDLLYLMGVGLKLQDENLFVNCHRFGTTATSTTLRSLYYPCATNVYKENQIRCGEHSDYGSITLLFQDDVGGLQVFDRSKGEYIDAVPIDGSVVVNIGDLMQQWTSDQLISTKHRVLIPQTEVQRREPRQSLAFFVHPDDDCLVECIDGSGKYEPVTGRGYLLQRFSVTYT